MKKYQDDLMVTKQEHSMLGIDCNVADSRIKDLLNQKAMTEKQILQTLTEKRAIDRENDQLAEEKSGKKDTEVENKKKQLEEELRLAMQVRKGNEKLKDTIEMNNALLADEEQKAKKLLDEKISTDQEYENIKEQFADRQTERKSLRQELLEK
jgi:hypothetical protein